MLLVSFVLAELAIMFNVLDKCNQGDKRWKRKLNKDVDQKRDE